MNEYNVISAQIRVLPGTEGWERWPLLEVGKISTFPIP
jgi:hypothetical protein